MDLSIHEVQEGDLASLNDALNEVCAERRFLGSVRGFPIEVHRSFLKAILKKRLPQVVAVDGSIVIGWCDILPNDLEGFTHVGRLGMGLRKPYRGRGIGNQLIMECIRLAKNHGLEKVELEVFSDNLPAIRLYLKQGFIEEGRRIRARKLDGHYQDVILMGLQLMDTP